MSHRKSQPSKASETGESPVLETIEVEDGSDSPFPEALSKLLIEDVEESSRIEGVVIGKIVAIDDSGEIRVDFPGNLQRHPMVARSAVAFQQNDAGREVALIFEKGDPQKPIIVGPLCNPEQSFSPFAENGQATEPESPVEASVDGQCVTITAKEQIVLRCGKASITLTRAGKILIRGKYILSRSSGVNRIKGGSVQLN